MSRMPDTEMGMKVRLTGGFEAVRSRVVEALKAEGFGVLTEIDVEKTLREKLDVGFRPYRILGACNPSLAHRALSAAPDVGLLLPCNVTVSQEEDGSVVVALVDPMKMLGMMEGDALKPIAVEARARLERVAAALAG